jgi:hypothetical protein
MLGNLAARLADGDNNKAVESGVTMAFAGVAAIGGAMAGGGEIGGPVAGLAAQAQQEVGGRS